MFTTRQLPLRTEPLAWRLAAASLGADVENVMTVKQVHGNTVRVLHKGATGPSESRIRPEADALISNEEGVVLAVQVADCVPVLMADRRTGAAAAVHSGWRGTLAGVSVAAIHAMRREFGTDPRDLTVALGPCIGTCCYEVGFELLDAFRSVGFAGDRLAQWFTTRESGSLRLDVAAANADQIHDAGVPRDRIHLANLCTQTHADVFESFRADKAAAGRMAGMIRVRS